MSAVGNEDAYQEQQGQTDPPGDGRTGTQPLRVTLPGAAYQQEGRWWWSVQLPGEGEARSRPLKAEGAKTATASRDEAERIALEMWGAAIRAQARRQTKLDSDQTLARLKAQFLDKVRHFTEVVQNATAKAEAEARARAEAEAKVEKLTRTLAAATTRSCECCGMTGIPLAKLKRIDSGQHLCPRCLAAFRIDAVRARAHDPTECPL